jgi:nitrite reductase/ring-hydroxylating ferredoxin subunit
MNPMSERAAFPVRELADGGRRHVVVAGVEVTVFRCGERYFALRTQCPHANGRLGDGVVQDGAVVCPLHRWKFDLATGTTKRDRRMSATPYRVAVEGDEVVVGAPSTQEIRR